jgi:nitrate/TMAO reductase-like tetraheme cytochrome c subunit
MGKGFTYIFILLGVFIIAISAAELSSRSITCMACHTQEAQYREWMQGRLASEKKGFSHELISCADCHILGSPERTVASKFRSLSHAISNIVPQIDPRKPEVSGLFNRTRIASENCKSCHAGAVRRKAMLKKDMPSELQKIGLQMDHRKHVISSTDTCAKCHERYKPELSQADKSVTFTEVNHLACDSCHTMASHSYRKGLILPISEGQFQAAKDNAWQDLSRNPRWMVSIPTEQSCRRCHNGQVHYKTPIFLADCRQGQDYETCKKCHPLMTKEYFEQRRLQPLKTHKSGSQLGSLSDAEIGVEPRNRRLPQSRNENM